MLRYLPAKVMIFGSLVCGGEVDARVNGGEIGGKTEISGGGVGLRKREEEGRKLEGLKGGDLRPLECLSDFEGVFGGVSGRQWIG